NSHFPSRFPLMIPIPPHNSHFPSQFPFPLTIPIPPPDSLSPFPFSLRGDPRAGLSGASAFPRGSPRGEKPRAGGICVPNLPRLAEKKASIGYTYEDSTVEELENSLEKRAGDEEDSEEDSNTDEDEVIPDIDVEVDVDELNQEQVADLNKQATTYGMAEGDFV
ncbi:CLK4-associating serine/arginine rich protein-like, partial [Pyrgilauda ruficollis]|uniref:CLK4-associating serine/arginine rich protein-like n=1 Tax=Pyrgilauda ruficollis TaxID=221976 RepID=UPI001B8845E6